MGRLLEPQNPQHRLSPNITTIASIVYNETSSDSIWDKLKGALLNSLAFVAVITVTTFILVLLFYFRCTKFLKFYMGFSAFVVLGFMGGEIALFLIRVFSFPIDCVTFVVILFNFAVVGVLAVFVPKMPILVTQGYMVVIGMLVAYWFTMLPEWTTWALLVALALYDLAAVLLPGGPLRLLVELAMSRDEEIPALVYEARPVNYHDVDPRTANVARTLWRGRNSGSGSGSVEISDSNSSPEVWLSDGGGGEGRETRVVVVGEGQNSEALPELLAPLVNRELEGPGTRVDCGGEGNASMDGWAIEGIGLGSSGAIKLGLGDFIFYSVLVGRAAMYDFMTVYACYLAIIAGLGITLMLLAFYRKALPALPVSILLGSFGTRNAAHRQIPLARAGSRLGRFLRHEQGRALARARPRLGTSKAYFGKGESPTGGMGKEARKTLEHALANHAKARPMDGL
ncbi:hypothetical protein Syun_022856 [Stephania yunnanensis]|uniref:Presenilin n=1 Tax=Stephania yunnanensis TaxID=152371 RepID=A0AAP0I338_9MAGN